MKTISKRQFDSAFHSVLAECFEMFFAQRYYIEVLTNEHKFFMLFSDCKECDYYNASGYFHINENRDYAFKRDSDMIKTEYYEFETLESAKEYAFKLMSERTYND